ncbi:FkbM family methyltransferase [Gelidibacter gilvus]|uniref:FkbM family methyltransferase n=1 Tax=Gelidibacter gilvus TaxID=59602 RepID=A0A4Q0XE92_9FLAO|nr:FkbM family methyltransferase [Gelidibacter gilvus]RXJ45394.1 FkbM family methyltransferase [Gelidibacter gilvus]
MNKHYFKRPFYHLAGRASKILRNFQISQDKKIKLKEDKLWNDLFKGDACFKFELHNIFMNLYKDSILSRIIYNGFEKDEIDFIMSTLKKDDIFIDIGSNIGLFSLIASHIVGEKGKVICFEPSPVTFERLKENVKLNNFDNIDCRNIGLSNKKDELSFYISENGHDAWNSFAPSTDNKLEDAIMVQVSTLDHELRKIDKEQISLVKIDVEGWEKFVLSGGIEFFTKYNPVVMVEFTEENTFNAGYPVQEIFDIMQDWGYQWHRIVNNRLIVETKKMRYPYVNLVAIKN